MCARYGLLGQNGCGKTNFLQCLANREVPIPMHMDLYHLREEAEPQERTALEARGGRWWWWCCVLGGCLVRVALRPSVPPSLHSRPPFPFSLYKAVVDHIKAELARLNALEEEILTTSGPEDERLESIYERLEEARTNCRVERETEERKRGGAKLTTRPPALALHHPPAFRSLTRRRSRRGRRSCWWAWAFRRR